MCAGRQSVVQAYHQGLAVDDPDIETRNRPLWAGGRFIVFGAIYLGRFFLDLLVYVRGQNREMGPAQAPKHVRKDLPALGGRVSPFHVRPKFIVERAVGFETNN